MVDSDRAQVAIGALCTVAPAVANRALARIAGRFREHNSFGAEELERVWRVVRRESTSEELAGRSLVRRNGPMLRFEHLDVTPTLPTRSLSLRGFTIWAPRFSMSIWSTRSAGWLRSGTGGRSFAPTPSSSPGARTGRRSSWRSTENRPGCQG